MKKVNIIGGTIAENASFFRLRMNSSWGWKSGKCSIKVGKAEMKMAMLGAIGKMDAWKR